MVCSRLVAVEVKRYASILSRQTVRVELTPPVPAWRVRSGRMSRVSGAPT